MKVLLIGPPGSGKGTIGRLLATKLDLPFISGGDILRSIDISDKNYNIIKSNMKKGSLLPSDLASKYYINRLSKEDCKNGFVLDGWPRSLENLKYFDPKVDIVIFLDVTNEVITKRILGRRYCKDTGVTINIHTLSDTKIDCPSGFIKRSDDTLETLTKRLDIYTKDTIPVINYYKDKNVLYSVNGNNTPKEVLDEILQNVDFI